MLSSLSPYNSYIQEGIALQDNPHPFLAWDPQIVAHLTYVNSAVLHHFAGKRESCKGEGERTQPVSRYSFPSHCCSEKPQLWEGQSVEEKWKTKNKANLYNAGHKTNIEYIMVT